MLIIVIGSSYGALKDEIASLQSSIQGYIMNNEIKIEEEAKRLAGVYGEELIIFSESNCKMTNRMCNFVLLRAITKLPDKTAVQDAMYNMVTSEKVYSGFDAITVISFCEREVLLNVAFRLAQNTISRQIARFALELIELFGDESSISSLVQLEENTKDKWYKETISVVRKNIVERTNWSAEKMRDWDRYAIPYWRIPREVPSIQNVNSNYFIQAELLKRRGFNFPDAFLKERLFKSDPLAVALLVMQKGGDSIGDLKRYMSVDNELKSVCSFGIEYITNQQNFNHSVFFDFNNSEE
jgi:hypothetical protein